MTDLAFQSATRLARELASGHIGSLELLDHLLARIERYGRALNAVVTLDAARAREQARKADEQTARGAPRGPLHGLPITVKDAFETQGMRTTSGAPEFKDYVPSSDAPAVARLRAAGAIVFGKTNMPTYGMDLQTYNAVFGTTRNPWDLTRTPGGSSGGSAAAVAAGLSPLELGSDVGGSIRVPASFCGTYGHKSSFGIIPMRGHIPGAPGTLADIDMLVAGPIARSADDLDLALRVLAGPDSAQAVGWHLELPPARRASLGHYRLAAWLDDPACPVDHEVRGCLEALVDTLRRAGATVDQRARPALALSKTQRLYQQLLWGVWGHTSAEDEFVKMARYADRLPKTDESLSAQYVRCLTQRKRHWNIAHEQREQIRRRWAEFFTDYDALLCPAMPTAAFPHDQSPDLLARTLRVNGEQRPYVEGLATWAGLASMAFLPATVAPAGFTAQGLPVGVQIIGPYLEDRTSIDVARAIGEVVGDYGPPPGFVE